MSNVYPKNRKIIQERTCNTCGLSYVPLPMGYNSIYCSKKCKPKPTRTYTPEKIKFLRRQSFGRSMNCEEKRKKHLESSRNSRRKILSWLSSYKIQRGCKDCGFKIHPAALQLDHEGPKSIEIADARTSITRLKTEIENGKCVVRCANCHSIKTWCDKNKIKYIPENFLRHG